MYEKIRNMEEFANACGVSRPTVSKYFNDPQSVRKSTRIRIEQALDLYDFRPNQFAINQNRKLTKNVGIVVPNLGDPFFAEIARVIETKAALAGFRPTLFSAHGDPRTELQILDTLRSLKPAGVMMAPIGAKSDRAALEKFARDIPTVIFDSKIEGIGHGFVGSHNLNFPHVMVDYLCRTGEPPVFLEMATPANPNANKRRHGYIAAMEKRGFEPRIVKVEGEGWEFEEIGRAGGHKAIRDGLIATNTVLCSNDRLAIGFLVACFENGLKVGNKPDCDIRVAGHDDHPFSRFTCPPLTTVAQDYEAISAKTVEMLKEAVFSPSQAGKEITFEGKLIMRQSA